MARQSIADIRKKEILTTFYEIAKKEGLDKTSFSMIAQKLEIQPSLIVHYFKNRSELIDSLIQYNLDQYENIFSTASELDEKANAYDRLIMLLNKLFSKEWDHLFDDGVFYSCYALSYRDEKVKAKFRELHLRIRNHIQEVVDECNNEGVIAVENSYTTAQLISNLMDGAYYYVGMLKDIREQDEYMESVKYSLLKMLNLDEKMSTAITADVQ
ncbi:MAG: TetR family transcriptional regulator [Bacteroidota bacterium]